MDRNTKFVACISLLLASTFFLSITALAQQQRNERFQKLSDNNWCRQRITEAFPDYPVITFLGNVTNTAVELEKNNADAWTVYWMSGQFTEYYRWFTVSQREPDPALWDPTNLYDGGFITSDLEIYEAPPWGIPPGP